MRGVWRLGILFGLFWLMGLSLGYPTLNRYKPGPPHVADAIYYSEMVEVGVTHMRDVGHWRYRVLVPALAHPVYEMVKGRAASWDPRFLALLVVNAAFCAGTATMLYLMASSLLGGNTAGLLAAFLFLLNFNTSNLYLSGLVDSAELFVITVALWAVSRDRWFWLPALAVIGSTAKETFIVYAGLVAAGWWLADLRGRGLQPRRIAAMAAMGVAGLATVAAIHAWISGHVVLVGDLLSSEQRPRDVARMLADVPAYLTNRSFWYTFGWTVPLAVAGLHRLPRQWLGAAACSLVGALLMCVWAEPGDNIGRPMFAAIGPVLTLAAAAGLTRLTGKVGP